MIKLPAFADTLRMLQAQAARIEALNADPTAQRAEMVLLQEKMLEHRRATRR